MKFVSDDVTKEELDELLAHEYRICFYNEWTDRLQFTQPEEWWTIGDTYHRYTDDPSYSWITDAYIERNKKAEHWELVE